MRAALGLPAPIALSLFSHEQSRVLCNPPVSYRRIAPNVSQAPVAILITKLTNRTSSAQESDLSGKHNYACVALIRSKRHATRATADRLTRLSIFLPE